ncbi:aminoacyl-histidine dipeptidase [Betaproteobacteria bacterium]|nr:aminoacyl-histidine dipeptidase [Betaproteobacteria bacterium]
MVFSSLQPASVWRHFSTLCAIPRASGHEEALRAALAAWAHERGLGVKTDAVGNLILSRPASAGYDDRPGVVLQGHLDMVCQKNGASAHNFAHDPIHAEVRDGWVVAPDTTLGADNGIGVALALAALEADDIEHPALEVLLTVDEETGMGGARGLHAEALSGRLLLNLDTEEWGEVYLGCAGSADVLINAEFPTEPRSVAEVAGWQAVSLRLTGLVGGHSGIDIHRQRGNAIKLLARVLHGLTQRGVEFRLAGLNGGTARNALPREAEAVLLVADLERLREAGAALVALLREDLSGVDDGLRVDILPAPLPATLLHRVAARNVIALLHALPQGVRRLSNTLPGVVDTSNNVGVLRLDEGRLSVDIMVRSLRDAGVHALSAEIVDLCALGGIHARITAPAPGWTPNPDSALLALVKDVYRQNSGGEATTQVIHAGLECGLFAALWPEMDIVSFGPTIHGAHAPGERVEIASVEKAWRLLTGVLAAIPPRS